MFELIKWPIGHSPISSFGRVLSIAELSSECRNVPGSFLCKGG